MTLRAERRIYKSLKLFGAYEYERALSDQAESRYTENIVSGGHELGILTICKQYLLTFRSLLSSK